MRLVHLDALSEAEQGEWTRLSSHAAQANAFFDPIFVTVAANSPNARRPGLLIAERRGQWIGCLPVRPVGPFGFSGWRHPYSSVGTPLVDDGHLEEFAVAMVKYLENQWQRRFLLLWKAIDCEVIAAIRAAVRDSRGIEVNFEERTQRAALRRRDDEPEAFPPGMKPRRRKELEKNRRRMTEALDGELEVVDRSSSPEAVDQFLRLEADGWKGKEGTALETAGDAAIFRAICNRYAEKECLQLLSLESAGKPVAMQCNLSSGDMLFNFKVAFDERYRKFAPGIQLEVEGMRIFQEQRQERILDSCADPDNELMNRLWPDRLPLTTTLIGPGGVIGRGAGRAIDRLLRHRRQATPMG